jgi:hypothetical protein
MASWWQPRSEVVGAVQVPSGLWGCRPGPTWFCLFSNLSKTGSTWKLKKNALPCSKISQILHTGSLRYYEHFSPWCRHQIPNRNWVKNLGSDSPFETLLNFYRGLILLEKSDKFPKILLHLNFTKVNLVGITCMQEKGLQSKWQTVWVEKNKNSFNLKFKPYNISCTVKLARISFKLLNYIVSYYLDTVEHCSSYSDARGVTVELPNIPIK